MYKISSGMSVRWVISLQFRLESALKVVEMLDENLREMGFTPVRLESALKGEPEPEFGVVGDVVSLQLRLESALKAAHHQTPGGGGSRFTPVSAGVCIEG